MRQNPFTRCLAAASNAAALPDGPLSTIVVHVLASACPLGRLRDFRSDAPQWLPWTMPTLQSVQSLPFGQWLLKTRRKMRKLRPRPVTTPMSFTTRY